MGQRIRKLLLQSFGGDKCKKCGNDLCYVKHFEQNFDYWTSDNYDIDEFIKDTQLSAHNNISKASEWIPYNRFDDIKYISENRYEANWIDGYIYGWDNKNRNWKRFNQDMLVTLKSLNNPKDVTSEFTMNKVKFHGITQNPQTKVYMMVLSDKSNWIDGYINRWDNDDQNWIRSDKNMIVILKILEINTIEFINTIKQEKYEFYGISQEPQTKNYMMVLSGKCMKRNRVNIRVKYCQEDFDDWTSYECKKCNHVCNASYFQKNFENWTSEWIPYNRFYDIKYIARGGFGKVYKANWIDGRIVRWDNENKNWERSGNKFVALKSLNNSSNATFEFMNEISLHHRGSEDNAFIVGFYGITQHPETKNYIMVLDYAEDGSLRDYLDKTYNKLDWDGKIGHLHDITLGLTCIHEKRLIHRDLHIGNILKLKSNIAITDMGLCKPADYNQLKNAKNNVYGILPYIAPEILRGGNYTKAADIYSLGIIIYEMISGFPPYYDLSHDNNLAIKICQGLRPKFNIKVPQLIVHLIKRCLDSNPLDRPKAGEIEDILYKWKCNHSYYQTIE
ncbi:kinase-like domain-containing protein [Rhizophagus clarus]|uniref:Kinase-like domain-containing protein n=1 Tax=Rhizophagus clarus TaxID=94130 RepID=A0A8H3M8B3_9GLOM|nr:kinase-like domain-containing protein [Rhizophagus clarus]